MKKIISLMLLLALTLLCVASCGSTDTEINIGVMSGPTGMGMAKLMHDENSEDSDYKFKVYSDPQGATADLTNGTLDMLCLPTNTAANLSKKNGNISVLAINTLGSLYLMTDANTEINSVADLAGKTIYTSVPGSTTKPIIDYILQKNQVEATVVVEANHDVLVAKVESGEAPIAVLPEPKATAAMLKNQTYQIDLNLSVEWDKVSDGEPLAMGCIVVRNDFLSKHKNLVEQFLDKYEDSIEFIGDSQNQYVAAQMIYDAGVLPKLLIAQRALGNLYGSIVYIDGEDMKDALKNFYTAIGNAQPDDSFYYED